MREKVTNIFRLQLQSSETMQSDNLKNDLRMKILLFEKKVWKVPIAWKEAQRQEINFEL